MKVTKTAIKHRKRRERATVRLARRLVKEKDYMRASEYLRSAAHHRSIAAVLEAELNSREA